VRHYALTRERAVEARVIWGHPVDASDSLARRRINNTALAGISDGAGLALH
jgi:hypothetical protein